MKYTITSLCSKIETETGFEVYHSELPTTLSPHFFIDILNDNTEFADSKTHKTYKSVTIRFATKNAFEKFTNYNYMKDNFNCRMTADFFDGEEWYYIIYETQIEVEL